MEAELGRVSGDEDAAVAAARGALTDPGQAADFVARTGADCLAVSIGNVHGRYTNLLALGEALIDAVREVVAAKLDLLWRR